MKKREFPYDKPYKILSEFHTMEIEEAVNRHIENGYRLVGGTHREGSHFTQAVTWVEEGETEPKPTCPTMWDVILSAFTELWPKCPIPTIEWVEGIHEKEGDPWANIQIPDDGTESVISIDVGATVRGSVELLAHELAHAAVDYLGTVEGEDHGEQWRSCFDVINREYNRVVER